MHELTTFGVGSTRNNIEFKAETEALNYLVEKDRITDKTYWEKALDTTRNIEYLFMKWAQDVHLLDTL